MYTSNTCVHKKKKPTCVRANLSLCVPLTKYEVQIRCVNNIITESTIYESPSEYLLKEAHVSCMRWSEGMVHQLIWFLWFLIANYEVSLLTNISIHTKGAMVIRYSKKLELCRFNCLSIHAMDVYTARVVHVWCKKIKF
jgi:hypothetical protein